MRRFFSIPLSLCLSIVLCQQLQGESLAKKKSVPSHSDFSSAIQKVTPSLVLINLLEKHNNRVPRVDIMQSGTGIIVSSDGFILTNAHVVLKRQKQKFEMVEVLINQERYIPAKIVGVDREKDLAVIKVDARLLSEKLIPVKFGRADHMVVGQMIWKAGFSGTVNSERPTFGHGFITNVRVFNGNYSAPFGAVDAHISGGDSGGPIFNIFGEVEGLSTAVDDGIGFFIPAEIILITLPRLYLGDVRTGWLGISPMNCLDMQSAGRDDRLRTRAAEFLKEKNIILPDLRRGIVLMHIEDSAAGDAHLFRMGDAIIRVNQKIPRDKYEFIQWIAETEPGSEVLLQIVRDDKSMFLRLKVGEYNWPLSDMIPLLMDILY